MQHPRFTRTLTETGDTAEVQSVCERCGFSIQFRMIHGKDQLERKEREHAKTCQAAERALSGK
jgi:hypothetical protein